MKVIEEPVYWLSPVGKEDDFNSRIGDTIIDGKSKYGPWGLMTPASWASYSGTGGRLGLGLGQKYKKQSNGKWLKIEG